LLNKLESYHIQYQKSVNLYFKNYLYRPSVLIDTDLSDNLKAFLVSRKQFSFVKTEMFYDENNRKRHILANRILWGDFEMP